MAEQNNPQSPKPGKARRVALKIAQAAGESLMMRSPILGQAFEMTQMFKRPEQSEEGKHPSRLGNIMSIVRQSLVQNSTILRKIEMFKDTFDTFREDEDEQKKDSPQSKEKAKEHSSEKKQGDDAKPSSTFVEYLDNKENPYYLMMQDSKNYLEKIVELLTEQKTILERSMRVESEKSERQKSLSELGSVGREPDALTQVRTEQTLPPVITEGLGLATPPQQDDDGGWFSELIDELFDFAKKKGGRGRIGRGISRLWNNLRNMGRGLTGRGVPRGASPSTGGAVPRTAPTPSAGGTPVMRGAPTIPSGAPPVGPATPSLPSGAPPVGPAAAAAVAATTAAGTTATTTGGAGTTALSALSVPAAAAGATIAGLVGTVVTGYSSVRRSEELRQQYPELRGLNLGVAQEEYLVQHPELLAQAVEEAKRNGTYERNMRTFDLTYGQPTQDTDRIGSSYPITPNFTGVEPYRRLLTPPPVASESERMEELRRYISGISSPSTEKTQSTLQAITRPSVPLSFGMAAPSSSPVIVNNQGGPTSVNNGGNITNIITGGSSLTLPQLTYNLPSALN